MILEELTDDLIGMDDIIAYRKLQYRGQGELNYE